MVDLPQVALGLVMIGAAILVATLAPFYVRTRSAAFVLRWWYMIQYRLARRPPPMPERLAFEPRLFFLIGLEGLGLTLISLGGRMLTALPDTATNALAFIGIIVFGGGVLFALLAHDLPSGPLD